MQDGYLINRETKTLVTGRGNAPIPDDGSVEHIGDSAFSGRESLTTLVIPAGVKSIGRSAFGEAVTTLTIPVSVESIGEYAIARKTKILTVVDCFAWTWAENNNREVRVDEQAWSAQRAAEAARKAEAEKQAAERHASSRCQHCGDELKGLFSKKCASCGKPKDY